MAYVKILGGKRDVLWDRENSQYPNFDILIFSLEQWTCARGPVDAIDKIISNWAIFMLK